MCDLRPAAILLVAATLACSSRPYDWSPILRALDQSLPDGTPQARVTAVLDSLAFLHSQLDPRDSTITASKREPHASDRLVFSTLRVVLKFSGDGHLMQRTAREVFTGP
jgi:hypothetical protein